MPDTSRRHPADRLDQFRVFYDLSAPTPRGVPASEVAALFKQYQGLTYGDLLALPV